MPLLFQLTSCIPTKSNLCLSNTLATVKWPSPIQAPHIPSAESCVSLTLLRLYQRIIPCPRQLYPFHNKARFYGEELLAPHPTTTWRTTPCRLFATSYAIYSQLPPVLQAVPPSAFWGYSMPWWQEPTFMAILIRVIHNSLICHVRWKCSYMQSILEINCVAYSVGNHGNALLLNR